MSSVKLLEISKAVGDVSHIACTKSQFEAAVQVTVKFGGETLVFNHITTETLGMELKSLVRIRLGCSKIPQDAQFQLRSQANGRFLRVHETLEEVHNL